MTKQELRQHIRTIKRQFSSEQLDELSLSITEVLTTHPRIAAARVIMLYYPLPDEVDTKYILNRLTSPVILLPKVTGETEMELRIYRSNNDLSEGAFGIMEPTGERFTELQSIDVAIVPGMAFDKAGHRLGRGKGYYDRFLAGLPNTYKIGVCFPFQIVDNLPTDENDIMMDEIVSRI